MFTILYLNYNNIRYYSFQLLFSFITLIIENYGASMILEQAYYNKSIFFYEPLNKNVIINKCDN